MARRKSAPRFEPDQVPPYRASLIKVSEYHPASFAGRGEVLRLQIEGVEVELGEPLSVDLLGYFFPDMEARCGVTPEWAMARIESLRAGRNCTPATWARLVPLFWRLPHFGWRLGMPYPPKSVADQVRAWPRDIPRPPKGKKEAA